jgi:hypothetical protein
MSGFNLGRTYLIEFDEGHALHGVEIRMKWASIETTEAINALSYREGLPYLIEHVIEWNLNDEKGERLPITLEAAKRNMEPAVNKALIGAWLEAAYGVSAPLAGPSDDGRLQQEADDTALLIPMEPSSGSPES